MLKITVDTNTLPVDALVAQIGDVAVDIAPTSVTAREVEGTSFADGLADVQPVLEVAVFGESRWGGAVFGSEQESRLFEDALRVISDGSFPKAGSRSSLSLGERRQLRDAMILVAHVHAGRDVLVTDDCKAFGDDGSTKRQRLCVLAGTRILSRKEFVALSATLPRKS